MATYAEIWDGPARNYNRTKSGDPVHTRKKYVTIHNTSNDATAADEASYAKRRTDGVGSHYYVDDREIRQSADTDWRVGHVGSSQGNNGGICYEITGVNGWSRARWMSSVAWDVMAAQMARDCKHHGIEVRQLSITEMRAGTKTGFITHDQARLAWGGTTHTDPGPGFPMDHLLALVRGQLTGVTPTVEIGDEMFVKIAGQDPVYVPRGDGYVHMTSTKALKGATDAGHKLITVPTLADLEALLGKPYTGPVLVNVPSLAEALKPHLAGLVEAAAEAAVRRVMLDAGTPDAA